MFSHGTTHVVTSIAQLCIPIYSKEYYVSAYGCSLVLERAVGGRKVGAEFQNSNLAKLDKVIIKIGLKVNYTCVMSLPLCDLL